MLDAAVRVFARRGYGDASVQDVADELGMLKGSLYHYITTKEDLLFWSLEAAHREVDLILSDVAAVDGLAALERLELYVRRQVAFNLDNIELVSVYYDEIHRLTPPRRRAILDRRRVHEQFVIGLIEDAQAAGDVDRAREPRIAANCLFATIIWTYRWFRPDGAASRDEIAAACTVYALRGVAGAGR